MASFDPAVEKVLRFEGGYVFDRRDPGGETKYGISKRTYPNLNIHALTEDDAKAIYRRDWWDKYGYGRIAHQGVAEKLLDQAVNRGAGVAHQILQLALNALGQLVDIDGRIGPETLQAVNRAREDDLLRAMKMAAALSYLTLIKARPELAVFRRGWLRRAWD